MNPDALSYYDVLEAVRELPPKQSDNQPLSTEEQALLEKLARQIHQQATAREDAELLRIAFAKLDAMRA